MLVENFNNFKGFKSKLWIFISSTTTTFEKILISIILSILSVKVTSGKRSAFLYLFQKLIYDVWERGGSLHLLKHSQIRKLLRIKRKKILSIMTLEHQLAWDDNNFILAWNFFSKNFSQSPEVHFCIFRSLQENPKWRAALRHLLNKSHS